MGRLVYKTLFLSLLVFYSGGLTGCSVATPQVVSLLSNFSFFKLKDNDLRIGALSELTSFSISATCSSQDLGFEYELPGVNPGVWTAVPSSSGGIFTSVTNNCVASQELLMVVDFSSVSTFMTMTLGSSQIIRFRDITTFNISTTDELRITYSTLNLSQDRLIYGQGFNDKKTSGNHSLRGRVISISNDTSLSGTYEMSGKVTFQ